MIEIDRTRRPDSKDRMNSLRVPLASIVIGAFLDPLTYHMEPLGRKPPVRWKYPQRVPFTETQLSSSTPMNALRSGQNGMAPTPPANIFYFFVFRKAITSSAC